MGASFDRLRCEVFQNLFLSPMNTGFVRPAMLQQYLPFTVLKLFFWIYIFRKRNVATVLTVYGIETNDGDGYSCLIFVATVLTVYGIETNRYIVFRIRNGFSCNSIYRLRY